MKKYPKPTNDKPVPMLREWDEFKKGRIPLRTWTVDPHTRQRGMRYETIEEIRHARAEALKRIRSGALKLSQAQLAHAINVNVRTLQGWEIGKSPAPGPVMVLLQLMRDMPEVKKALLSV